jgi:hypothetical protein
LIKDIIFQKNISKDIEQLDKNDILLYPKANRNYRTLSGDFLMMLVVTTVIDRIIYNLGDDTIP